MKIKWYGQAKFRIEAQNGKRLITDPYDATLGYAVVPEAADVVTSSHDHFDHNGFDTVLGDYAKINQPGMYEAAGFRITGIPTEHDDQGGALRGKNTVFVIEVDGIKICHMGDLGRPLTEEERKAVGTPDVLLLPVGGYYTMAPETAAEVADALGARVVIPMHFKTKEVDLPIQGPQTFIDCMREKEYSVGYHHGTEIELDPEDMPRRFRVMVLEYK